MAHTQTDEAIVLHAYDIGEADRLCILLTKQTGKIAVRAPGVRRMRSRKGGSLLPLQHIHVQYRKSASGYMAQSTTVLATHAACRDDIAIYGTTLTGIELLLRTLEDEHPFPEAYDALLSFLTACATDYRPALFPLYALSLFDLLGTFPSLSHSVVSHQPLRGPVSFCAQRGGFCMPQETYQGHTLSDVVLSVLRRPRTSTMYADLPLFSPQELTTLQHIAHSLIGSQLGSSVRSSAVTRAISSSVTPI